MSTNFTISDLPDFTIPDLPTTDVSDLPTTDVSDLPTTDVSDLPTTDVSDLPIDTEWTDEPICPYCGESDQDWWDGLPPKNDGDSWTVTCSNCEKEYTITMYVSTTFDTKEVV